MLLQLFLKLTSCFTIVGFNVSKSSYGIHPRPIRLRAVHKHIPIALLTPSVALHTEALIWGVYTIQRDCHKTVL